MNEFESLGKNNCKLLKCKAFFTPNSKHYKLTNKSFKCISYLLLRIIITSFCRTRSVTYGVR